MQGAGILFSGDLVIVDRRRVISVWQAALGSPMLLLANRDDAKPLSTQESGCDHGIEYRWGR